MNYHSSILCIHHKADMPPTSTFPDTHILSCPSGLLCQQLNQQQILPLKPKQNWVRKKWKYPNCLLSLRKTPFHGAIKILRWGKIIKITEINAISKSTEGLLLTPKLCLLFDKEIVLHTWFSICSSVQMYCHCLSIIFVCTKFNLFKSKGHIFNATELGKPATQDLMP